MSLCAKEFGRETSPRVRAILGTRGCFVVHRGGRRASRARHRGEVALLTGPATAADEYYEELPHGPSRLGEERRLVPAFGHGFSRAETSVMTRWRLRRFVTLGT